MSNDTFDGTILVQLGDDDRWMVFSIINDWFEVNGIFSYGKMYPDIGGAYMAELPSIILVYNGEYTYDDDGDIWFSVDFGYSSTAYCVIDGYASGYQKERGDFYYPRGLPTLETIGMLIDGRYTYDAEGTPLKHGDHLMVCNPGVDNQEYVCSIMSGGNMLIISTITGNELALLHDDEQSLEYIRLLYNWMTIYKMR